MFRCLQRLGGGLGAVESTLCLEASWLERSVPSHVECAGAAVPSLAVHMAFSPPAGKGLRAWHSSKQQKSMMQSR